jgi:hypothetical protein
VLDVEKVDPVFILGMPRSGTNYLSDLLCLHDRCAPARAPIREDFFLEASDHLLHYASDLQERWDPTWGVFEDDLIRQFYERLGDGLISFLWVERERRLVAKTASVRHLDRFFMFFPRARLLIVVRDGRSVVQSSMSTFGWDFDLAARKWAAAADEIRRFCAEDRPATDRYRLVHYEDLLDDLRRALSSILRFLELEEDTFDWAAAADLPVRGSSSYFGPGRDSVHWDPVQRTPGFDPKERWRSWSREMHERFEWIAGSQLRHLGYRSETEPVVGPAQALTHRFLDWRWQAKTATRVAIYRARVTLGTATLPLRKRLGLVRRER